MLGFLTVGFSGCNKKESEEGESFDDNSSTNDSDDYVDPEVQLRIDIKEALKEAIKEVVKETDLDNYFNGHWMYRYSEFEDNIKEWAEKEYPELNHKFVIFNIDLSESGNYCIDYGYYPYSNSDEGLFCGYVNLDYP